MNVDTYEFSSLRIGSGSFGYVLLGRHRVSNEFIALKIMHHDKQAQNEANILLRIAQHPNICKYYGSFNYNKSFVLALEFIFGQNLLTYFHMKKDYRININIIINAIQNGLSYLHKNGIAHRDIKPENIMFNHNEVKIIDFDLSICKYIEDIKWKSVNKLGTDTYFGPERYIKDYEFTFDSWIKGDIFAFGVLVYELVRDEELYDDILGKAEDNESCKYSALHGIYKFPTDINLEHNHKYWPLIKSCIEPNPNDRILLN